MSTVPTNAGGTEDLRTSGDDGSDVQPVLVEAVSGPASGARTFISSGSLTLGSGPKSGLVLEDPAISSSHASIELVKGAVTVRDLGSRNGTWYLEAKINEARVPLGGTLRLGRTTLRFSPVEPPRPLSDKELLEGVLGRSVQMRELFTQMEKLGPTDSPVLIIGETGTGKEAIARALHQLSKRREHPFVVFDCASANVQTIESELFGHVRGAFTGAVQDRVGLLSAVGSGTLLLDSIGDLTPELQPKLLRVLEGRSYVPVGGAVSKKFEGRVLAASNTALEGDGRTFRSDLLFRIAVSTLVIPPLRERIEDIPLLAAHFARALTGSEVTLSRTTLAAFQCARWPGNVRELRNAVERAVMLGEGPEARTAARASGGFDDAKERLLASFERDYLLSLINRSASMTDAIAESKLSRTQFYRLLRRHQISSRG